MTKPMPDLSDLRGYASAPFVEALLRYLEYREDKLIDDMVSMSDGSKVELLRGAIREVRNIRNELFSDRRKAPQPERIGS